MWEGDIINLRISFVWYEDEKWEYRNDGNNNNQSPKNFAVDYGYSID